MSSKALENQYVSAAILVPGVGKALGIGQGI